MKRVGCAGILVRDTFCGPLDSLPAEGELVSVASMPTKAGGCAANVAIDLSRQGLKVGLAGCLGRDSAGDALIKTFAKHCIECDQILFTDKHPTSETIILLVQGEDRRYLHSFGANQSFTGGDISRNWLAGLNVFYFGGLFAMPGIRTDDLIDLFKFCREHGVITILDVVVPSHSRETDALKRILPHTDWFLPNDDEARKFTGQADPFEAMQVMQRWGASNLVVTLGKSGALAARGAEYWQCGAYAWDVKDPSGAGDAFASGIITGIVHGWDMPQILRYASALGASATRAVGTTDSVFTLEEAQALVATDPVPVVPRVFASISA